MKILFRVFLVLILICALIVNCAQIKSFAAVTVASECDIDDIDAPVDAQVTETEIGQTLDLAARSAILLDVNTGTVLYDKNSDEPLPPASITKIMSFILIFEYMEKGCLKIDDVISASSHAASMGGSQIWLKENESMTVDDLLKAAVIASANDAVVALAEAVSGSEEGFVAAMNKKAQELGLKNTHFENASGLDAEGHLSSAHDIAVMSAELMKHPQIKNYSTVWMESLRGGQTELVNTNKLIRYYDGATGLKTGTTSLAGCCLSATAERDGLSLVCVIMAAPSSKDRFNDAKKLLDFGFSNFSYKEIAANPDILAPAKVKNGCEKYIAVKPGDPLKILCEKGAGDNYTQNVILKNDIKAPVKKGDIIGVIEVKSGEKTVGEIELTANADCKKKTFLTVFIWLLCGMAKK